MNLMDNRIIIGATGKCGRSRFFNILAPTLNATLNEKGTLIFLDID